MEQIKNMDAKSWYKNKFAEFEKSLNGEAKSLSHLSKKESINKLDEISFPDLKDEDWKYTNVSAVIKENFLPAQLCKPSVSLEIEKYLFDFADSSLLVFENGIFNEKLSKIHRQKNVFIGSLKSFSLIDETNFQKNVKFRKTTAFDYLNESFGADGFALIIGDKTTLEKPVQVLFINGNADEKVLSSPRIFITVGKFSEADVILNFVGDNDNYYLTNINTAVQLDENSNLNLFKIQNESKKSFHFDNINISQSANSTLNHFNISFGGKLSRNGLSSNLIGEGAECNFNGLYIANENQHVDNHTFVNHAVANCNSNETYKGILDDLSRGVFNGKIVVAKDAQKTNAYQSNKTILLSDKSRIDTKPQLEIFADDVKCSHGATVGRLDEQALFYIISRGIPSDLAKSMLIRAFANDVIEKVNLSELKEQLNHMIFENLHRTEI